MNGFALRTSALGRGEGGRLFSTWHTVTYLTSAIAFVALFMTGELHPAVSIGFCSTWFFGFVYRRPIPFWRQWMSSALTILVIVLLVMNFRAQFFQSLLTLLLYLVLAKSLMLRSPRDYLQTQILCFFMLLATAVITVSFYLLFCLIVYLGFATMGFVLYSLTRPEDRGYSKDGKLIGDYSERLPKRLALLTARYTLLLMLLTVALFIAIPHLSVQRVDAPFSSRRAPEDAMSGYSDEVDFGEFKSLKPDLRVVLRIEPSWAEGQVEHLPDHLYLRGSPLETYEPQGWRRSKQRGVPMIDSIPKFMPPMSSTQRGRIMTLRVHQNPDFTKRIFTVPVTQEVDFGQNRQIRMDRDNGSLQIASLGDSSENTYTNPLSYSLACNVIQETGDSLAGLIAAQKRNKPDYEKWVLEHPNWDAPPRELPGLDEARLSAEASRTPLNVTIEDAGTSDTLHDLEEIERDRFVLEMYSLMGKPGEVNWLLQGRILRLSRLEREINLQLPKGDLTDRIGELAREIAPGPSEAEVILQLLSYFRTNFSYTLSPETPSGMHPIDAFLFETKMGHCEYFATAFTLMLRSRGIPARLINGFYTTEWNALGQIYIAKQSDAHAWSEVWLDGPGWITVDPTSSDVAGRGAYGASEPTIAEIVSEFLRIQWQRYVIDYSSSRQIKIFKAMRELPVLHLFFDFYDRTIQKMLYRQLDDPSGSSGERTSFERRRDLIYVLDGVLLLLLILGVRRGWYAWRRREMRVHGYTGFDYVDRLIKLARRYGARRMPHETMREFMDSLSALGWSGAELRWVGALYERHRFGGEAPSATDRCRAEEIIRSLPKPERRMSAGAANATG